MGKRILLAWEIGGGRGHVFILGWIARALRQRGCEPVFAVRQMAALESIRSDLEGIDCLQAPLWPGTIDSRAYSSPGPATTVGDIIAELGLRSIFATERMLHAWDRLLVSVQPDVIVANNSPALLLAARGKIPTVAVGEGFTLPPSTMEKFPSFAGADSLPKYPEHELVEVVNACLRGSSREPVSRLPEIFAADRSCVGTFVEFDSYQAFRQQPNAGPWCPVWDRRVPKEEREIFCYLGPSFSSQDVVVDALQEVAQAGIPVRAHMPVLDEAALLRLAGAGVAVERDPVDFTAIQHRTRLAVSLGSLSFVSCALVAGIPQIVFRSMPAQKAAADTIERLGVGRAVRLSAQSPFEARLLAQLLLQTFYDADYSAAARRAAPDFERRLEPRPEEVVAGHVMELV